jgi:hypothetical protein
VLAIAGGRLACGSATPDEVGTAAYTATSIFDRIPRRRQSNSASIAAPSILLALCANIT